MSKTKSIFVFSARPIHEKHLHFKNNTIPIMYDMVNSCASSNNSVRVDVQDIALPMMFEYPHFDEHNAYYLHEYKINTAEYERFVRRSLVVNNTKVHGQWLAYWLRSFIKADDRKFMCSFDLQDIGKGERYFPPGYITFGNPAYQMFLGIPPDDLLNWSNLITF